MNNKKPAIYHNVINKNINNCSTMFSTLNKENIVVKEQNSKLNNMYNSFEVRQKIYNIFKSPSFIYKADVNIVTDTETIKKRIIGKVNDDLITMDNEKIPINTIRDIYR